MPFGEVQATAQAVISSTSEPSCWHASSNTQPPAATATHLSAPLRCAIQEVAVGAALASGAQADGACQAVGVAARLALGWRLFRCIRLLTSVCRCLYNGCMRRVPVAGQALTAFACLRVEAGFATYGWAGCALPRHVAVEPVFALVVGFATCGILLGAVWGGAGIGLPAGHTQAGLWVGRHAVRALTAHCRVAIAAHARGQAPVQLQATSASPACSL